MQTKVELDKVDFSLNKKSKIFSIGSCFADVLGNQLKENIFDSISNPFGTVFNSYSLFQLISNNGLKYIQNQIFEKNNDGFYSYGLSSNLWNESLAEFQNQTSTIYQDALNFIDSADCVVITLGTSWAYQKKDSLQIVNNCHKKPQSEFEKIIIDGNQTFINFKNWYQKLILINPSVKVILTVSPVRHIKDTLVLNNLSKSHLIAACYQITNTFPNTYYFPAFEILIDELRDYRFYKDDMIHPTLLAEKIVWDRFKNLYLDSETNQFIDEWQNTLMAINHKPINNKSLQHQKLLKSLILKLEKINETKNVQVYLDTLKSQLI